MCAFRKRKFINIFTAVFMICLMTVSMVQTVYAADYHTEEEISIIAEQIRALNRKVYDGSGDDDQDYAYVRDLMIDRLDDITDEKWASITCQQAAREDLIQTVTVVIGDDKYASLCSNDYLYKLWCAKFGEYASTLGIPENDSDSKADAESLETMGRKINILTWNNTEDSSGKAYSDSNVGAIEGILAAMDKDLGSLFSVMSAIGIAMTLAFGLGKLIGMTADRNITGDAITREFVKIIAGAWFVANFKFFALLAINIGAMMTRLIPYEIAETSSNNIKWCVYQSLYDTCSSYNIAALTESMVMGTTSVEEAAGSTGVFSQLGNMLIEFIEGEFIEIASSLAIYSVLIELAVRYLFTPIAIADLYSERFRSSGWNWLKHLISCAMTGAIMYAMVWVCQVIKESMDSSLLAGLAIDLTMIGMLFRAHGIANEVIGVR